VTTRVALYGLLRVTVVGDKIIYTRVHY